jgi:septal ring factor EnvC (AmiA/AmiB activator)
MLKKLEGAHIIEEMKEAKNISIFKGKLIRPVLGKIVHPFGPVFDPRTKTELPHPGLDIEAKTGAPVMSNFSGVVLFSDWFSGYGNLIIIVHGLGYVSLYEHLAELSVNTGYLFYLTQKIGSIHKSHLYFEMRYQGRATDPMEWIIHSK